MVVYISVDPDDAVSGGGLLNDVDVEWKCCRYERYGFPRGGHDTVSPPIPCFALTMVNAETGEEYDKQYYSAGKAESMMPTEDGLGLVQIDPNVRSLWDKSSFYHLMSSLRNNGFPKEKIAEVASNAASLEGLRCHMMQEPSLLKRKNPKKRADGTAYEDTTLVVSAIHKLPWEVEKKGVAMPAGSKGKVKVKGAETKTADADAEAIITEATGAVLTVLTQRDGQILKRELATEVWKQVQGKSPNALKIVNLMNDDAWLGADDKPWKFADGMLSMA